jgi:hypothetical protein
LELYEVSSTTGEALSAVILDALVRFDLSLCKLRAQCYERARNMSGAFSVVQAKIRTLQPKVLYVHCTAHALNLVLQETACEVPTIQDGLQYLYHAAVLLGRSARKAVLERAGRIKALCPTRRTVRSVAIATALTNYAAILSALDETSQAPGRDDPQSKARGLQQQFDTSRMYWSMCVASQIFRPSESLSKTLQSATMTVTGALAAVRMTRELLMSFRSERHFEDIMKRVAQVAQTYGLEELAQTRIYRPPKKIDSGSVPPQLTVGDYYRQQYSQVFKVVELFFLFCIYVYVYIYMYIYIYIYIYI